MRRQNRPGDHAPTGHFQIFTRSELDFRRALQTLLLHDVVVLLPAVIRKRSYIIKNESVVLGVELRRSIRRTRAPSGAIAVDELAKGGIVRGLLLGPGANESQQCTHYRQRYIQQPAPSLGIFVARPAHRWGRSVSPSNPESRVCRCMSQCVPLTVVP